MLEPQFDQTKWEDNFGSIGLLRIINEAENIKCYLHMVAFKKLVATKC
jgi:hypothetical protein